jgi:hypothetical protein
MNIEGGFVARGAKAPSFESEANQPDSAVSLFRRFYSPDLLRGNSSFLREDTVFMHPRIRSMLHLLDAPSAQASIDQRQCYAAIKGIETQAALEHYWQIHSTDYLSRLDTLSTQLPEALVTGRTKAVVIMAAMNETEIDRAVASAQQGYHGDFDTEVSVVVYHNFKTQPTEDVKEAAIEVAKRKNVFVVSEQVGQDNASSMARKVVTDVVQRKLGNERAMPFLLMDADVKGLTVTAINDGLAVIDEATTLATSPDWDFDPETKTRYPVLGTVWDVARAMRQFAGKEGYTTKTTLGPFTLIDRKILAAVGGIKVVKGSMGMLFPVLFEDMELARNLEEAVGNDTQAFTQTEKIQPVYRLEEKGHVVILDTKREIASLLKGQAPGARWRDSELFESVSGTKRDNAEDNQELDVAELGGFTDSNLCKALNRYRRNEFKGYRYYAVGNALSRELVRVLRAKGFQPNFTATHRNDIDEQEPNQDVVESERLVMQTNQWRIADFTQLIPEAA